MQGGGAVTYLERMLAFERYYLERRESIDPGTIHEQMMDRIRFYEEYLGGGRSPDDIAADSPAMAAVREDIRGLHRGTHYGRPFAWHQQAARRNFLRAWVEIGLPTLVVFHGFDQFESRHGHRLIVDMVNRGRPGSAEFVELARLDHGGSLYPTIEDAYEGRLGVPGGAVLAATVGRWLARLAPS